MVARLARAGFVDGDQARLVDRGLALGLARFGETQPLYLILGRKLSRGTGLAMLENTRRKPINDEMRNKTKSLVKRYFIVVDGGSRRALVVLIGRRSVVHAGRCRSSLS